MFFTSVLFFISLIFTQQCLATDSEKLDSAQESDPIHVSRYTSLKGWNVNSYWLENSQGIVLIDAQLLTNDAEHLAVLLKSRNKKIAGLILTHPHPDHYGGTAKLQSILGKFPIYATQDTIDNMQSSNQSYQKNSAASFGKHSHKKLIMPTHTVKSGETLNLAGMKLLIDDLGKSESIDNVVVWSNELKTLFTGDATMHFNHFYVGEGYSAEALKTFDYMKKTYSEATILLSGHGDPARLGILDNLKEYVLFLREQTFEAMKDSNNLGEDQKHLTREARAKVAKKVIQRFPNLGDFGFEQKQMVSMNIYGIEKEDPVK